MRGKLTYSNVMSTIAVFLALAGGSFAVAAALDKNRSYVDHARGDCRKLTRRLATARSPSDLWSDGSSELASTAT